MTKKKSGSVTRAKTQKPARKRTGVTWPNKAGGTKRGFAVKDLNRTSSSAVFSTSRTLDRALKRLADK
jgi:hypothetical protein